MAIEVSLHFTSLQVMQLMILYLLIKTINQLLIKSLTGNPAHQSVMQNVVIMNQLANYINNKHILQKKKQEATGK